MAGPTPLPDHALVVRGGDMRLSQLENNARNTSLEWGRPGVSVRAGEASAEELLAAGRPLPQRVFRRSTAGRLRAAGFEIEPTGSSPRHATVWLADWGEATLRRLVAAFDPPEENPLARPEPKRP